MNKTIIFNKDSIIFDKKEIKMGDINSKNIIDIIKFYIEYKDDMELKKEDEIEPILELIYSALNSNQYMDDENDDDLPF